MSFTHELLRQFDRESVKDVIENLMSTRFFEEDVEFGFPISEPVVGLENAKKKFYGIFMDCVTNDFPQNFVRMQQLLNSF